MPVFIQNSLTKKKEELIPLNNKTVKMYACGVTVYDKCHIGHARSLYVFDVIRRYLQYRDYDVFFVRNITDVDDKIINKGKELNKSFEDVVEENIKLYQMDVKNLEVGFADKEPRATENIDRIIEDIKKLITKDFAYESDGNVYFSVRKFKNYGQLSGQSVEHMLEAVRIDQDHVKKDTLDFALWKKSPEGEVSWSSPWGNGRPGWHIECTCMSMKYLESDTIDIHAGGRDLIFPHHENEIAQSEALTGKPFAKYWIHHGLLTINKQKMSKSLKNFITLDEVLEKFTNDVLKMFYLQSHYSSSIDFSWEKIAEVKRSYERICLTVQKIKSVAGFPNKKNICNGDIKDYLNKFETFMDDDFNTPRALSVLFDLISESNRRLESSSKEDIKILKIIGAVLQKMTHVLGLHHVWDDLDDKLEPALDDLIQQRIESRKEKDYARSDELRDLLKESGILVEDGKDGQTWRRV